MSSTTKETLESGGHKAVVDILNNLGHNSGNYIPKNKKRLAVLKVNRPFSSWESFLRLLKEGHEDLKERHKRGNRELGEFLDRVKSKQCLRKSFAPAIGIDFEDAEDCLTSLNSWEQEEMGKMPPVPCKHCLGKLSLEIESDLGFWLENRILEQLGCNESHLNLMFEDYDLGMEIDYGRYVAISLIDDDSIAIFENLAIPANCAPAFVDLEGEPLYHSEYSIDANVVRIGQLDYPRAFAVVCFEKEGLYSFKLVPKNEYSDYGDD